MKIRSVNSSKSFLAWGIILGILALIAWPFTYIPASAWLAACLSVWHGIIGGGIILGFTLWVFAIIAGGISIIGLTVPTLAYFVKWIHWAFTYALWADKKEPQFPPIWTLDTWKTIGDLIPAIFTLMFFVILLAAFLTGIALLLHGNILGMFLIMLSMFAIVLLAEFAPDGFGY